MQLQVVDRLLTIFLCSDLVLALWNLALAFPVPCQAATGF